MCRLRIFALVALVVVVPACSGTQRRESDGASPPGESRAVSPPSGASEPPPSGAGGERLVTVDELLAQPDPLSEYGGDDLVMNVRLTSAGAVDCPSFSGLEPDFFHCSHSVLLGAPEGAFPTVGTAVFAVLHSDIAELREMAMDQELTLTAHYDDPAASTCRFDPYEGPAPEPSPEEVVLVCRSTLVITAIDELQP